MENLGINKNLSFYKDKKIFVTGHTGFKGAWFITWLHLLGANIKGYSLPSNNKENLFDAVLPHINIEHISGDIRDKQKLEDEIRQFAPDFIFHFAAQSLVRKSYKIPSETFEINVIGTTNILEALVKLENKCTTIIITTDKVYENREANYFYKETDTLGGYDPYSASKAATEIAVDSFRNSFFNTANYIVHQKAIATVRAGNVIGGGDWNEDRIIPDIVRSLRNNDCIDVRNPNAIRPWQHVLEPLFGYLIVGLFLDKNATVYSGAYNFGPNNNDHLTVKDLVEKAIGWWGTGTWKDSSSKENVHEANLLMLDINKAKNILEWSPKLSSSKAIEWAIEWYKVPQNKKNDFTLQQINSYSSL